MPRLDRLDINEAGRKRMGYIHKSAGLLLTLSFSRGLVVWVHLKGRQSEGKKLFWQCRRSGGMDQAAVYM